MSAWAAITRSVPASNRDQLAMDAPRGPKTIRDFADRRVGPDRLDDQRQEVVRPTGGVVESGQRGGPGRRVALGPDAADALHPAPLPLRIDPLERRPPRPPSGD